MKIYLTILLIYSIIFHDGLLAKQKLEVSDVSVYINETATLPCKFNFINKTNDLYVVWERKDDSTKKGIIAHKISLGQVNDSAIAARYKGRTSVTPNLQDHTIDLVLTNLQYSDFGKYICRVAVTENHGDKEINLKLIKFNPISNITYLVGQNVTIQIQYEGLASEINWKKNKNKVLEYEFPTEDSKTKDDNPTFYSNNEGRQSFNPIDGALTIVNLTKQDAGEYKAEVWVDNVSQETIVTLNVLECPEKPKIFSYNTNDRLIMYCNASAQHVTYYWKDNLGNNFAGQFFNQTDLTEIIVNLTCIVTNELCSNQTTVKNVNFRKSNNVILPLTVTLVIFATFVSILILVMLVVKLKLV